MLLPIGAVLTSLPVVWRLPRVVVADELPETAGWVRFGKEPRRTPIDPIR